MDLRSGKTTAVEEMEMDPSETSAATGSKGTEMVTRRPVDLEMIFEYLEQIKQNMEDNSRRMEEKIIQEITKKMEDNSKRMEENSREIRDEIRNVGESVEKLRKVMQGKTDTNKEDYKDNLEATRAEVEVLQFGDEDMEDIQVMEKLDKKELQRSDENNNKKYKNILMRYVEVNSREERTKERNKGRKQKRKADRRRKRIYSYNYQKEQDRTRKFGYSMTLEGPHKVKELGRRYELYKRTRWKYKKRWKSLEIEKKMQKRNYKIKKRDKIKQDLTENRKKTKRKLKLTNLE